MVPSLPSNSSDAFRPAALWPALELRAALLRRTREFFYDRAFLEVETPILSHDTVVDRHLDPLESVLVDDPRADSGRRLFLQTSPEFAMKRLLASGAAAIYQITRAFRQAEVGPRHNPEFTIVEWYRPGDDLAAGMQLLSDLCEALLARGPAERLTYGDAFRQYAAVDPFEMDDAELRQAAASHGVHLPDGLDRDGVLDVLLVERVEPHLGLARPTILHDYPPSQAALAVVRDATPPVAERFELYVAGVELANGYHELLDPHVLAERNHRQNELRVLDGKRPLPEHSRLLAAMAHGLPACSGCALGFDRVVMLAAGAATLAEVTAFPIDRA